MPVWLHLPHHRRRGHLSLTHPVFEKIAWRSNRQRRFSCSTRRGPVVTSTRKCDVRKSRFYPTLLALRGKVAPPPICPSGLPTIELNSTKHKPGAIPSTARAAVTLFSSYQLGVPGRWRSWEVAGTRHAVRSSELAPQSHFSLRVSLSSLDEDDRSLPLAVGFPPDRATRSLMQSKAPCATSPLPCVPLGGERKVYSQSTISRIRCAQPSSPHSGSTAPQPLPGPSCCRQLLCDNIRCIII